MKVEVLKYFLVPGDQQHRPLRKYGCSCCMMARQWHKHTRRMNLWCSQITLTPQTGKYSQSRWRPSSKCTQDLTHVDKIACFLLKRLPLNWIQSPLKLNTNVLVTTVLIWWSSGTPQDNLIQISKFGFRNRGCLSGSNETGLSCYTNLNGAATSHLQASWIPK